MAEVPEKDQNTIYLYTSRLATMNSLKTVRLYAVR